MDVHTSNETKRVEERKNERDVSSFLYDEFANLLFSKGGGGGPLPNLWIHTAGS